MYKKISSILFYLLGHVQVAINGQEIVYFLASNFVHVTYMFSSQPWNRSGPALFEPRIPLFLFSIFRWFSILALWVVPRNETRIPHLLMPIYPIYFIWSQNEVKNLEVAGCEIFWDEGILGRTLFIPFQLNDKIRQIILFSGLIIGCWTTVIAKSY